MKNETWKPIPEYEGLYEVSDFGCFRNSVTGKIRKTGKDKAGYHQITVSKDGKRKALGAHRVVARVFLGESSKPQVNHIDGNKENNRADNLEWVTAQENVDHAISSGLSTQAGSANGNSILNERLVKAIKNMTLEGVKRGVIAKLHGVSSNVIGKIQRGETWNHV